ncbi:MAG: alpha/beta fold hydrolase [Segniliparus sp.]|uniref:alpha/beta fold hydrolase n=1 Tax=Segniliparus sp. TaxID=2804064 RepID=UPI003F2CEB1E
MGRGRTWSRHLPWLQGLGRVVVYDASWHRGRGERPDLETGDGRSIATERFVEEAAAVLEAHADGPAVVVGHSMGGLHAWCLAAARPELVQALVVEDMAPDFRGRTLGPWEPWLESWPVEFPDDDAVDALVGPVAGRYFRESFDRIPGADGSPGGYRLHGHIDVWCAIAAQWGKRDYWAEWAAVQAPALLVEAAHGVTPAGQMREMAERKRAQRSRSARHVVLDAGHLAHDVAPGQFQQLVTEFLREARISSRR